MKHQSHSNRRAAPERNGERPGLGGLALVSLLCLLLGFAGFASAQQVTGSIAGVVTDDSGAVLRETQIELTNTETGISISKTSGADGTYSFNAVKPGSYEIKASAQGFKAVTRKVEVELNRAVKVNLVLSVGAVNEVVAVTAEVPTVDLVHTHVATNVEAKTVVNLPSINRDVTSLVALIPTAEQRVGTTSAGSQVVDLSGNYALGNGTRRSQSVFYLDGSENMGAWRLQALQLPNPDTIEEVQVVSSSGSAEFGKEPGVSMNAITKSGTNDFHGTVLYAGHNGSLNANSWTANRAGTKRPDDGLKWWGATLGGPIVKNRTFFFASFQRFQTNDAQNQNVLAPTAAMLNGDFSAIPGFSIKAINPATGLPIGNVIPASLISPIAKQLKDRFVTAPSYSNDPVQGRYNWQFERVVHNNEWLGKIDHKFSDEHQITLSYLTTKGQQDRPDNVSGVENQVPGYGGDSLVGARQHTASIRHTWLARPNVVVENRVALGNLRSYRSRTELDENLATLGAVWPSVAANAETILPNLAFSAAPGTVNARGGQIADRVQQNIRGLSTVSWNHGDHNFKFGAEMQFSKYHRIENSEDATFNFTGAYSSASAPLNGPWPTLTNPSGDNLFAYSWADFLLGRARSFTTRGARDDTFSGNAAFFFAQDQWRITPRLTLSPGLRYELYGTQGSNGILAGYIEGHKSNQYPNAPVGYAFAGDTGVPDGFRKPDRNNIAPRLGIAYDLTGDGKTALRAGGGVYYAYPPLSIIEQLGNTVAAPSYTGNNASLVDPWGTSRLNSGDTACQFAGCIAPGFGRDPATLSYPRNGIMGFAPDIQTPYQYQFNVSAERELRAGLSLEVAYVGNRAKHGFAVRDVNLPVYQAGESDGNRDARRPNPIFTGINLITTDADERFDAGTATVTYKHGSVYARLAYTRQRFLTAATDAAQEVGISNSPNSWTSNPRDIEGDMAPVTARQILRAFIVYAGPTFENKTVNAFLGDWQISGNFFWNDGSPLNVTLGRENNFDGFGPDRPDQVGPIVYVKQQNADGSTTWIDKSAFANPPVPSASNPYPFGNLPRNAVRGPANWNSDAALMKTFQLKHGVRFQIRADATNVFNHPVLSNPNLNLSSADFGLIRTKDNRTRVMQLQGKLIF